MKMVIPLGCYIKNNIMINKPLQYAIKHKNILNLNIKNIKNNTLIPYEKKKILIKYYPFQNIILELNNKFKEDYFIVLLKYL